MSLLLCAIGLSAGSLGAQDQQVVFPSTSLRYSEAIAAVERQTSYVFSYAPELLDVNSRVELTAGRLPLREALGQMLDRNGMGYMIHNKYVIVFPRADIPAPVPAATPEVPAAPATPARSEYRPLGESVGVDALPRFALKSNLLYGLGTLTPNLAVEAGLGPRTSLLLSGSYNPWNRKGTAENNKKLVHWVVRPEFRYWFCERFNGHFVGANPFYNQFNISEHDIPFVGFKKEFRYEGNAFGFGVNYGYQLPVAARWGVEFSAGVGIARMGYDVFGCTLCSGVIERKSTWWFGPTHASVSLAFMIR
ncbi:MAG: DUF3575 domain-containing protein [Alistipes sp.]|nr:DUF3575 domain-containing protein [Alistipes sp.]